MIDKACRKKIKESGLMSMKNIKKASVVSVLSLALAIPLTASAAATTEVTPSTTDSIAVSQSANTSTDVNTPKPGDHVITPQATDGQIVDRPVAGFNDSADFDVKSGYEYVRLYLRNTGNTTITFTVNQGSASGAEKYSGTVKPGKTFDEILNSSKPWTVGKFYVSLSSGSGSMSGKLGVRTSTNTNF
ncbi:MULTISPECIES: hypothetical protein [unclassified Paenibacillus]|uniref:hypothetical protein n=2 Tax=unclassified Paenibacillus TaxID=185978 RepID=UPI003835D850